MNYSQPHSHPSRAFPHLQQHSPSLPNAIPPRHLPSNAEPIIICAQRACATGTVTRAAWKKGAENTLPSAKLPVWRKRSIKTSMYPYTTQKKNPAKGFVHRKDLQSQRDCKEFHLAKPTGSSRVSPPAKLPDTSRTRQSVPSHARLRPSQIPAVPPRAGSLQASLVQGQIFLPSTCSEAKRCTHCPWLVFPFPREASGKGNPEQPPFSKESLLVMKIVTSYFRLHFCRVLLLEKAQLGASLALEVPPALSRRQAALLRNAHTRQPCLQLWQAPQGYSAGAGSLQSSVRNINYVQRNAPNREDRKANLVQKPADSEE